MSMCFSEVNNGLGVFEKNIFWILISSVSLRQGFAVLNGIVNEISSIC